jgi:hypothetical protein
LPLTLRIRNSVLAAAVIAACILVRQPAMAGELALAQGTVAISDAPAGQRAPACGELFVEARDALDNHLIARTQPELGADGACRYALSVPAQSAVWLHLRTALVAATRVTANGASVGPAAPFAATPLGAPAPATATAGRHVQGRGVQIRWTVIAPTTYFFAPGEQKTVPLTY